MMAAYDRTVYIVIPVGDAAEYAVEEDLDALRAHIGRETHLISHAVTDPVLCDGLTQHLLDKLATA